VAGLGRKPKTSGYECQRVKHYDMILFRFSMPRLWLLFLEKTLLCVGQARKMVYSS